MTRKRAAILGIALIGLVALIWMNRELARVRTQLAGKRLTESHTGNSESFPVRMPSISPITLDSSLPPPTYVGRLRDPRNTNSDESYTSALEIYLVDAQTDLPVPSGHLIVSGFDGKELWASGRLEPSGSASFSCSPGKYDLAVDAPDYLSRQDSVEVPRKISTIRKVIRLERLIRLRGLVKNNKGVPAPYATITFFQSKNEGDGPEPHRSECISGSDGRFKIVLLSRVIDKVFAYRAPHPLLEIGPIALEASPNPYLELVLRPDVPAVRLTGRVLDEQATPRV